MDKKVFLMAVIVICVAALIYLSFSGGPVDVPPPLPAEPPSTGQAPPGQDLGQQMIAPDFTLENLDGGMVSLSQFRGKVVLINFWSSGCPPCLMEMPSLEKLKKAMEGKPFEILAITADPRVMAERTVSSMNINLTVLLDPNSSTIINYGAYALPTTYIIAPDGSVENKLMGAANWGDGSVVDYLNKFYKTAPPPAQPE